MLAPLASATRCTASVRSSRRPSSATRLPPTLVSPWPKCDPRREAEMEQVAHHLDGWIEELVEEIDETGRTLRVVSRARAHQDGLLHAVVVGMLIGSDGRFV